MSKIRLISIWGVGVLLSIAWMGTALAGADNEPFFADQPSSIGASLAKVVTVTDEHVQISPNIYLPSSIGGNPGALGSYWG